MSLGGAVGGKKPNAATCHLYPPSQRASPQPALTPTVTQSTQVALTHSALSSNWGNSVSTVSHTEGHL